MRSPVEALQETERWAAVASIGDSPTPLLAVDLRGLDRGFRRDDGDARLAAALAGAPWVSVALADHDLDPVFAPLVDAFDIVLGHDLPGTVGVDPTVHDAGPTDLAAALDELTATVTSSPRAAVALVQLLRLSHTTSVEQALFAESLTYATLQTGATFQSWLAGRTPGSPLAESRVVIVERTNSLLEITLDRPDRRNAFNTAMRDQLFEALELVDLDPSIDGAVLRGSGSNFSAGGDLDEFGTTPSPAVGHHVRMVRSVGALLHRVSSRVRVHVHGSCVGAGIELPAFAHSIIARSDATFRLPEVQFGLVPGAGGTVSVTRRCGRHRTAWLALANRAIDAPTALQWGLIDRIDDSAF